MFTSDASGLVSAEILITYVHLCSEYARELERLQREQTEQEEIARIQQLAAEAEEISRYIVYSMIAFGIAFITCFAGGYWRITL